VTVQLFSGSSVEGQLLQSATFAAPAGAWSGTLAGLSPGTYTARAEQSDDTGNVGLSAPTTFTITGPGGAGAAAQAPAPPAPSFTWFPSVPKPRETVSLASSSTDVRSPITGFAWDLTGSGTFAPGAQVISTSFATAGNHVVRLRVTAADGLSSMATETIPVLAPVIPLMQPFPVVRIASTDTASGIRLRVLRVLAPAGARIGVECKGRGCPARSASRIATAGKVGVAPVEFRGFEHSLRAGVVLEIRISKAGEIGKFTSFQVRRRRLPLRVDACLGPTGAKPIGCPP
jgi:PKD domain